MSTTNKIKMTTSLLSCVTILSSMQDIIFLLSTNRQGGAEEVGCPVSYLVSESSPHVEI